MTRPFERLRAPVALAMLLSSTGPAFAAADLRLVDAVERNDRDTARRLLSDDIDVDARRADGAAALHWAAYWDAVEIADQLLRKGASVDAVNDLGVTPLSLACRNGSLPMVETLLGAGADARGALPTGETAFMTCARAGSPEAVEMLLAGDADPNAREGDRGQTALMWAVAERHTTVARTLIDAGADVDARSAGGFTPLLFAARSGALEAARLLVAAGADVNAVTPQGQTPLFVAAFSVDAITGSDYRLVVDESEHDAVARLLLEQGAEPNLADEYGMTALHAAVEMGKRGLVPILLEHGADPNLRLTRPLPFRRGDYVGRSAYDGATPFWLAARLGDVESMRTLVAAGADPELPSSRRVTPLMVASGLSQTDSRMVAEETLLEAVEYLVTELGADVHAVDGRGQTAVHGAASTSSNAIITYLVEQGASPDAEDQYGRTPQDLAESTLRPRPLTSALLQELSAQTGGSPEVETGLTEDRWVRAIEIRPGTIAGRKITHHALARLVQEEDDPLAANQDDPASRRLNSGLFMEWAVGKQGELMRPGSGKLMKAGSKIVWDIHYSSAGEEITDSAELGIYLYPKDEEPAHRQVLHIMNAGDSDIAPNEVKVTENFFPMRRAGRIESFQPHMHLRGKAMSMEAVLPNGRRQMLSHVGDFNFNWHNSYVYTDDAAPLLPKGTMLKLTAWHDNTAANRANPDPDVWVGWGDRTVDEMAHAWVNVTYFDDEEYKALVEERKAASESSDEGQE